MTHSLLKKKTATKKNRSTQSVIQKLLYVSILVKQIYDQVNVTGFTEKYTNNLGAIKKTTIEQLAIVMTVGVDMCGSKPSCF